MQFHTLKLAWSGPLATRRDTYPNTHKYTHKEIDIDKTYPASKLKTSKVSATTKTKLQTKYHQSKLGMDADQKFQKNVTSPIWSDQIMQERMAHERADPVWTSFSSFVTSVTLNFSYNVLSVIIVCSLAWSLYSVVCEGLYQMLESSKLL